MHTVPNPKQGEPKPPSYLGTPPATQEMGPLFRTERAATFEEVNIGGERFTVTDIPLEIDQLDNSELHSYFTADNIGALKKGLAEIDTLFEILAAGKEATDFERLLRIVIETVPTLNNPKLKIGFFGSKLFGRENTDHDLAIETGVEGTRNLVISELTNLGFTFLAKGDIDPMVSLKGRDHTLGAAIRETSSQTDDKPRYKKIADLLFIDNLSNEEVIRQILWSYGFVKADDTKALLEVKIDPESMKRSYVLKVIKSSGSIDPQSGEVPIRFLDLGSDHAFTSANLVHLFNEVKKELDSKALEGISATLEQVCDTRVIARYRTQIDALKEKFGTNPQVVFNEESGSYELRWDSYNMADVVPWKSTLHWGSGNFYRERYSNPQTRSLRQRDIARTILHGLKQRVVSNYLYRSVLDQIKTSNAKASQTLLQLAEELNIIRIASLVTGYKEGRGVIYQEGSPLQERLQIAQRVLSLQPDGIYLNRDYLMQLGLNEQQIAEILHDPIRNLALAHAEAISSVTYAIGTRETDPLQQFHRSAIYS